MYIHIYIYTYDYVIYYIMYYTMLYDIECTKLCNAILYCSCILQQAIP